MKPENTEAESSQLQSQCQAYHQINHCQQGAMAPWCNKYNTGILLYLNPRVVKKIKKMDYCQAQPKLQLG